MSTLTLDQPGRIAGPAGDEPSYGLGRAVVISIVILLAAAGLSIGVYLCAREQTGNRVQIDISQKQSRVLSGLDASGVALLALALVGGMGCMAPPLMAAIRWRGLGVIHLQKRIDELQGATVDLQTQLTQARRAKEALLVSSAETEKQVKELATTNARLAGELGKRDEAERALKQRRQELESSKSVLELHVQARSHELQQLQRRYEMILNSAGEGICGLDLEGKATFVNPAVAKLTGWPLPELIGKTEQHIFSGNGAQSKIAAIVSGPGEQVFHRRDGTPFPVEVVRTPINEDGRVVGSVLIFKDITERKRVEEALAQRAAELTRSNSELEQFAFVASHDLQEPLRKIQAFGDRLKTKFDSNQSPDILDYLARMQSAAARMRTLIDDLLSFSRVIRSSEPFTTVDLAEITKGVLSDLEVRIEKSNAQVEVGELPKIDADPLQMRQLFVNLLSNALKFQPPGNTPVVKITCQTLTALSGEQLCELRIQDNGIGFDEKYLDKVFAVFQRLHGRSEYEGTGIGLAVCRRIVDRHHGSIQAKSQPGKGALFIVTLPLRQNREQAKS